MKSILRLNQFAPGFNREYFKQGRSNFELGVQFENVYVGLDPLMRLVLLP